MAATLTLQEFITQETGRFFHARGLEPSIDLSGGFVEFHKPQHCTEERFDALLVGLEAHLKEALKTVRVGDS